MDDTLAERTFSTKVETDLRQWTERHAGNAVGSLSVLGSVVETERNHVPNFR